MIAAKLWAGLLAVLAATLSTGPAAAQTDAVVQADALFSAITEDRPGAVVAVARGGETIYARAFGAADLEQSRPMTMATRFHVASLSKQFTGLAVALLARDGRIDLQADVRTYLPELPDFGARITVEQLLRHTGGLRDQWELFILSGTDIQGYLRQAAVLSLVGHQRELNFAPGSEFRYSNTGYTLAAEIVARVAAMPFRRFLEERIFAPLGMRDSFVYDDAAELVPGRAQSYRVGPDGRPQIARLNYATYGATSVMTTAADLLRWSRELLHPAVFDAGLIRALAEPGRLADGTPLNYGLGMYRTQIAGRAAIMHGGADAGFRAILASFPEEDASLVILSNGAADTASLHEALVEIFLNRRAPQVLPTVADPQRVARLAGYYVGSWGPALELQQDGGRLVRLLGGQRQAAAFRADGTFEFRAPTMRLRPVTAADGTVTGLDELPLMGPPIRYRRTERVVPSLRAVTALAGDYRSAELDVTYRLAMVNGRLVLTSLRDPEPVPLIPAERDRFDAGFSRIAIERGRNGEAVGFTVTTGRIRNLHFVRQR